MFHHSSSTSSKSQQGPPPAKGSSKPLFHAGDLGNCSTSNVSVDSLDDDYEERRKRDLGYELSLDESDIRSHEWYHGPITRLSAETTVEMDGDFLVRDCISSPGDFVLTCKSSGNRILHFRMNRLVLHAHTAQETVCYRFEEEAFPTIPDLISYYLSNKKPVSVLSGAVIKVPKPRKVPLGHYSVSQIQKQLHKLKNSRLRQSSLCDSMSSPSPTYSKSRTPNSDKRSSSRTNSGRSSVKTSANQQECLMEKYLKDVERSCLNLQANIMKQRQSILSNNNLNSSSNNFIPIMNNYRTFHRTQMGKSEEMAKASNTRKNLSTTSLNTSGVQTNCMDQQQANVSLTKSPSDSSLYQPFSCFKENNAFDASSNGGETVGSGGKSNYYSSGSATLHRKVKKPNVVVYDTLPRPRPCLSSTQIFYDHPRALPRPRPKVPPPPPPGSINLKLRKKTKAADTNAAAAESSEVSSTTDDNTSLLEHQELTPLLSSSTNDENDEREESSPLPEDPFPLGLNSSEQVPEGDAGKENGTEEEEEESRSTEDPVEEVSLTASNEPVTAPVAEKESGLRASSSSIEEIPLTPLLLTSAFNPSEFRTLYLPKEGNKPLDPTAINAVQRTILDTESEVLAYHLTKLDMDLLSITLDTEYGLPGIRSGLHLLTLVEGKQLREDLMERCLCLKYFVLTTILTATSKDQSVALLAKWISIAGELSGNLVGFFNVVNALSNPKLRGIADLWDRLESTYPQNSSRLETEFRPRLRTLNEGKFQEEEEDILIPHVVPFLSGCKDLRGLKTFRNMFNDIFKFSKGVPVPDPFPLFNAHIAYAQECSSVDALESFRENGLKYINGMGIAEEILLYDLFHTNFHLKLLWGSNGAVNQSCVERISKFEKVITVLASLCSK